MLVKLRILFTILSALCLGAIIPLGVWLGWVGFVVCGAGALLFFSLMLVCKQSQELQEGKNDPSEPDFLIPAPQEDEKKE